MISNPQVANSPVATRATSVFTSSIPSTASTYLYGPDYTESGVLITPLITRRPSYLVVQNQGEYNLELRMGGGSAGGTGSVIIAPLATFEFAVDVSAGIELYNPNPVVTINNLSFVAMAGVAGASIDLSADGVANFSTLGAGFTAYASGGIVYYTTYVPAAFSVTQF